MRNRWTRSTYRKRGKIKISPRGAGPRDETFFSHSIPHLLSSSFPPPLPPSLPRSVAPRPRRAPPCLHPGEQPPPTTSLFFTNAPCCQPDWPLCAGFANKFHLRPLVRYTSNFNAPPWIVAMLINDVKINQPPPPPPPPPLSETRAALVASSIAVVS